MGKFKKFFIYLICFGNREKIAKKIGVTFGNGCRFLGNPFSMFGSEPNLIFIGNHVSISANSSFITHHGEYWVLRDKEHNYNLYEKIVIGDNVFIGANCTILPGVTIGNNVVIGANSVVNKDIADNAVVAGIPANIICDFETFKKRKMNNPKIIDTNGLSTKQIKEAIELNRRN